MGRDWFAEQDLRPVQDPDILIDFLRGLDEDGLSLVMVLRCFSLGQLHDFRHMLEDLDFAAAVELAERKRRGDEWSTTVRGQQRDICCCAGPSHLWPCPEALLPL